MLASLMAHAVLLSIALGGQQFGLPSMHFPWQEKRPGPTDLQVLIAPATPPAAPAQQAAATSSPVRLAGAVLPSVGKVVVPARVEATPALIPPPIPVQVPEPAPVARQDLANRAKTRPEVDLPIAPAAPAVRARANTVEPTAPSEGSDLPFPNKADNPAQKRNEADAQLRALEESRLEKEIQSRERARQLESVEAAQRQAAQAEQQVRETRRQELERAELAQLEAVRTEAARQEQVRQSRLATEKEIERQQEVARQDLARQEANRQETMRQETLRQESARQEAARQDAAKRAEREAAARQEAARQEAAKLQAAREEAARQEDAKQSAARQESARQEAARQEAARQEAARQEALKQETTRQEAARQEAAKQENARQEAAKQEAARQESARQESARQEAAKQEAARQESAQREAARQDAANREAARQEAARQDAARQEREKGEQAQRDKAEQEAKREERLRAIGKQLNEEAAQRDSALNRPSSSLLPGVSSLRRGWLLGRADPNGEMMLYAEAMSQKIEMNMTMDMVRDVVKQPHTTPVVTVAVRADGSIEKITFVVSSGVPAIDDAIRKVVASQAPYAKFSPALARQYDVIEIRRSWLFDVAIRLQ